MRGGERRENFFLTLLLLYSVGIRLINEYGVWWNDIKEGKLKYLENNLPHWHFVYHKFHMVSGGTEHGVWR